MEDLPWWYQTKRNPWFLTFQFHLRFCLVIPKLEERRRRNLAIEIYVLFLRSKIRCVGSLRFSIVLLPNAFGEGDRVRERERE